ncbi:MAG: hypothetical protein ACOY3S_12295 [Pseudomonadota bacterium]
MAAAIETGFALGLAVMRRGEGFAAGAATAAAAGFGGVAGVLRTALALAGVFTGLVCFATAAFGAAGAATGGCSATASMAGVAALRARICLGLLFTGFSADCGKTSAAGGAAGVPGVSTSGAATGATASVAESSWLSFMSSTIFATPAFNHRGGRRLPLLRLLQCTKYVCRRECQAKMVQCTITGMDQVIA